MLPYWYKQMIENKHGRNFQRGSPGSNLVYKHEKFFIIGHFDRGYHPVINIRYSVRKLISLRKRTASVLCHGKQRTCHHLFGIKCMLTLLKLQKTQNWTKGNKNSPNIFEFLETKFQLRVNNYKKGACGLCLPCVGYFCYIWS